jgi:hypothetical protein
MLPNNIDSDVDCALEAIKLFYGDKRTKRSNVLLINHIIEGLETLDRVKASNSAKAAFCLHPLCQTDEDLASFMEKEVYNHNPNVIALVMEYRNIANRGLRENVIYYDALMRLQSKPIVLSPLKDVNDMLLADKTQNYKDFLLYNSNHEDAAELDLYFQNWLKTLSTYYGNRKK